MVQKIIPKEMIDKIMEEYACTREEATQAFLEAQSTFEETLHEKLGMTSEEKSKAKEGPTLLTPYEIKEYLDKFVIGQEVYKKRLAIAAAYHFAMVKAKTDKPDIIDRYNVRRFRKKNTLIAGASGSGKTYCVEVLADLMGVPVNVVDATDYTEAGYVGKSADDMIRELINMAPGETKREKAEFINRFGGLIFIDEMDKKAKEGNMVGIDVSREGFQRSVLKLIERKLVSIDDPNSPSSQIQELVDQQRGIKSSKKKSMISTENILFILGGSFQRPNDSMETIVKKRLDNKSGRVKEDGSLTISGFSVTDAETRRDTYRNYYKEAIEDDYIRFGIIPELVGRAPIRTYVNPLSKNDLVRIMTETEDSILNQYKLEFELFGIKVNFTNEAIEHVATKAEKKKTGARALVSEWETILTDFQYTLPGTNFDTLTVNEKICSHPQDQLLELFEKSPLFDFVNRFNKEFGIQIKFSDDAAKYVEEYAKAHSVQVSDALEKLMSGAAALNYINLKGEFLVEKHMLDDEKYFDKLYVDWHKKQMETPPEE
ncbi:MAG: AAA family ATPase [Nitrospinota bacterium]|nr:AAA family ATPase [Nitrospinota bacterium]